MTNRLNGKVAIVTGGASGIGGSTAEIMAGEGATVMIADINLQGAQAQAEKIRRANGRADAIALDLGDSRSIDTMIEQTASRLGGIDILFNNAADTRLSSSVQGDGIESTDVAVWDKLMQINLRGPMLCIKSVIPHMRARGGGSIINTASGAGLRGADGGVAYGVGKAGLIMMTKYVATQHGKEGIRCNAVAPGLILTPALDAASFGSSAMMDTILEHNLVPRLGKAEDIAWAVVWLASDESGYVTGQCIQVDGGATEHQPYWADFRRMAKPT